MAEFWMARKAFEPSITERAASFFALIFLGFLGLFLSGSFFYLLASALENHRNVGVSLAFFALSALAFYDTILVYHGMRKVGQPRRNENARRIFGMVCSGEIPCFCVFLEAVFSNSTWGFSSTVSFRWAFWGVRAVISL